MDRLAREMSAVTRVMVILGAGGQLETVRVLMTPDSLAEHTASAVSEAALTCLQTDALKSQIVLFASYPLPGKTQ